MERVIADLLFIVIALIVAALIGGIIGYLLGFNRRKKECEQHLEENRRLMGQLEQAKTNIGLMEEKQTQLLAEISALKETETENPVPFDREKAGKVMGKKVKENDLTIVEGIGPKISEILQGVGICTWLDLSKSDPEAIKGKLLEIGGSNYRIHEPATWPRQGELAAQGKWDELKKFQDNLTGGKIIH